MDGKHKISSKYDNMNAEVQPNCLLQKSENCSTKSPFDWNRQSNPAEIIGTSESARRNGSVVRSSKPDNVEYFVLDGEVVARETLVADPV